MEAENQSECQKEKKRHENIRKVSGTEKNIISGVTRKNVDIPSTSVTKPCLPSESVTKLGSQSKNGKKLNDENTAKTVIGKNIHKTGVSRKHSNKEKTTNKKHVKPITADDGDTKLDSGKNLPDESNTDSVNIKPCVTDTKNDVTGDNITKPVGKETPETEKKLDDKEKTEVGSDEVTVNERQEDTTEQKPSEITEDDDSDNQAGNDVAKKKSPKSSATIADMIDDAIGCFENEDYMKCIIICEEILNTDWKDPNDQVKFSKAFLYIGKSYEKTDELENALKYYQFSVAVSKNPTLSQHIEEIAFKLDEQKKKSAEEENKKGNDCFKLKQFKEALAHYTEAIKRNPEQAKFYSNRSACYLKLKEYLLSLSDAQNCIRFDPKSVKGYFREGAAYLALNKPSKACASYSAILQIDPDNEEAKKNYSKSTEKARLDPNDPEAVKKRIEEEPELVQILNDRHVRLFLAEMEKDPTAVKKYMQDISTRKKIQKLLECGLLNASGPSHLLRN